MEWGGELDWFLLHLRSGLFFFLVLVFCFCQSDWARGMILNNVCRFPWKKTKYGDNLLSHGSMLWIFSTSDDWLPWIHQGKFHKPKKIFKKDILAADKLRLPWCLRTNQTLFYIRKTWQLLLCNFLIFTINSIRNRLLFFSLWGHLGLRLNVLHLRLLVLLLLSLQLYGLGAWEYREDAFLGNQQLGQLGEP